MPKLSPDYAPLKIAAAPGTTMTGWQLRAVGAAIAGWNWVDPIRRKRLPDLMEWIGNAVDADAVIEFVPELDDVLKDLGHLDEMHVLLKDSAYGACVTDSEGDVHIYIDANAHKQLGPGWYPAIIQHELGHAGGLRHSDAVVPTGIMQASLVGGLEISGPYDDRNPLDKGGIRLVAQQERERLHELRMAGVVGVDSYEGN